MAETVIPGPVSADTPIREATCIHTKKIYDSCQGKDCVEDLRFYPTVASQAVLDGAQSVKNGRAELLYCAIQVDPVGFNQGFFTVDQRYFYKVTAEAYPSGSCRPVCVIGLCVFDKRSILFGSQGTAKIFTSECNCVTDPNLSFEDNLPTAVVEAVDPVVLNLKLVDLCCKPCNCGCSCGNIASEIPAAILNTFDDTLVFSDDTQKRLLLSLGQFTIVRMERDSQLLIPVYDYCMPGKECCCDCPDDDPCHLFQQLEFPVGEFFPPAAASDLDPLSGLRGGLGGACCQQNR